MTRRSTPPSRSRSLALRPGDIVQGKFRVERLLGEGGMGVVVEATHLFLRERVALKFLRPELLAHPQLVARFAFEARAAVKVKSDHVARVLDVGEADGVPFMVLEHLEGKNLGTFVANEGPLSLRDAAEYVIQACSALAEVHSLGIVHRDVKPENLFLVERGGFRFVKLLDFGVSKAPEPSPWSERGETLGAATRDEIALFETGELVGSPSYMAPEQLTQGTLDARTDLWALGAVLYELLSGKPLFDPYRPLSEIVSSVLHGPIPSLLDARPDLPLAIAGVLSRCLARDRELRFQSAAELAVALLPFAPRRSRDAAERAVSHVRSSGQSEPRIALPTSEYPTPLATRKTEPSDAPPGRVSLRDFAPELPAGFDVGVALRPAPVPDSFAPGEPFEPVTVRIARSPVPPALDSAPATAHSVSPTSPTVITRPRRSSRRVVVAAFAAAAAALALGLGPTLAPPALGGTAAAAPDRVERDAPAVLAPLAGTAEPVPVAAVAPRPRASCDNPYESARCLPP